MTGRAGASYWMEYAWFYYSCLITIQEHRTGHLTSQSALCVVSLCVYWVLRFLQEKLHQKNYIRYKALEKFLSYGKCYRYTSFQLFLTSTFVSVEMVALESQISEENNFFPLFAPSKPNFLSQMFSKTCWLQYSNLFLWQGKPKALYELK